MSTNLLGWNGKGKRLAIVEVGGDVIVSLLEPPLASTKTKIREIRSILELKISSTLRHVRQVVFGCDGVRIQLVGQSSAEV